MLNIVVSGLLVMCMFLNDIHAYAIPICRSFCFTCSNNADDFFFIDWAQEYTICISVLKIIMN